VRGRIDDRADKMLWVVGRTDLEAANRFDQTFQQKVVDFVDKDKARGGRTLLTLVAKG
jgi:head-tail adaptor